MFVEVPEAGRKVTGGEAVAVVEASRPRATCSRRCPARSSRSTAASPTQPALVNEDAEGKAWFFKIKLANPAELDALMDRAAYEAFVKETGLMRYLPLTEPTAARCWPRSASPTSTRCSPTCPRTSGSRGLVDLPQGQGRTGGRARARPHGGAATCRRAPCRSSSAPAPTSTTCRRRVDHLIQRSEFLTSYTPYQPEIAQGTLQYLFEFQTQVALLTGMEVANASMYDGSTAAAEAVLMAHRVTRRQQGRAVRRPASALPRDHRDAVASWPATSVVAAGRRCRVARGHHRGASTTRRRASWCRRPTSTAICAISRTIAEAAHAHGALLVVVVTEVVSLGLVQPPGEMGADIVVGEGQSIGNALNFGGPYVGLFATRAEVRSPDAGPAVRRDGRRGGPARLRADAVDARAAHPPREGDLQHLHQFGPVRAGVHRST